MTRSRLIVIGVAVAAVAVTVATLVMYQQTEDVDGLMAPHPSFAQMKADAEPEPEPEAPKPPPRPADRYYPGHADGVLAVAYSHDGTRLVTASRDRTARVWNAADGRELLRLEGHSGGLLDAAFSRDNSRIATAGANGETYVWDAKTGELLAMLNDGTNAPLAFVAFTPDGSVVTGSIGRAGGVRFWDVAAEREIGRHDDHESPVLCGSVTPDGTRAITGGADGSVVIWDLAERRPVARHALYPLRPGAEKPDEPADSSSAASASAAAAAVRGRTDIHSVALSADGSRAYTAMARHRVDGWDAATGRHLGRVGGLTGAAAVAMHPSRPLLAVIDEAATVRLFHTAGDRFNDAGVSFAFDGPSHAIAFRGDGERLAGGHGGALNLFFPDNWQPAERTRVFEWTVPSLPPPTSAPSPVPASTDGSPSARRER